MFHSRQINTKINNLHIRALRMVYRDGSVITVHHRNLQFLAVEMFKFINGVAPAFMKDILTQNTNAFIKNVCKYTLTCYFL